MDASYNYEIRASILTTKKTNLTLFSVYRG
jgi:hypothetical protein